MNGENIMKLINFINLPFNAIPINWAEVEDELEMTLHENIKKYYSKIMNREVNGRIYFKENLVVPLGHERNDTWLLNEGQKTYKVEVTLNLPTNTGTLAKHIESAFEYWTGGNDFGNRLMIGEFYFNMGQMLIIINNDTGDIEWIDCAYGYFEEYEENPHGTLAKSIESFLENLKLNIV